jgi:tRNA(Ile)-lysidine synthase
MHPLYRVRSAGQPGAAVPTWVLRYHVRVQSLAQAVLTHIRREELLKAGDRVGVAVSAGIDSVALLRLLLELRHELGIVLSVVHFNHRLRGDESDADQEFVASLAHEYDLEFHLDSDDVAVRAREEHISVETAAREVRYGFFRWLLGEEGPQGLKPDSLVATDGTAEAVLFHDPLLPNPPSPHTSSPGDVPSPAPAHFLNKIATGHTLDDQAETVIMRLVRGAGLRGLGGIHPRIVVEDKDGEICGEIVRPLLSIRRRELELYLKDIGQSWREDSTNADDRFTRNRVRKLVLPLLEQEFNPSIAENLAELAEIARGEEDYWENEISGWLGTTVQWSQPDWARAVSQASSLVQIAALPNGNANRRDGLQSKIDNAPWLVMNASVNRMWFLGEPVAVQRRLMKAIGDNARIPLEFKHVDDILRFASEDGASGKGLSLPLGWKLVRQPEELVFMTPDLREPGEPPDYQYELSVPGRVNVYEAGSSIEARMVPAFPTAAYNPDHLMDAESLPGPLTVRNWRPGDRFFPAHTKSPKKIKELLQEHHIAQAERKAWPVVKRGNEIVWVRGFPPPAKLRAKPGRAAIVIVDAPLSQPAAED